MNHSKRIRMSFVALFGLLSLLASSSCSGNGSAYCRPTDTLKCQNLPDQCFKQQGCSLTPGCSALKCQFNTNAATCSAAEPCRWDGTDCTPDNFFVCDGMDQTTCGQHTGCVWGMACTGMRVPCDKTTEAECEALSHCTWETTPLL